MKRLAVLLAVLAVTGGVALTHRTGGTKTVPTVLALRPADVHRIAVFSGGRGVELTRDADGAWHAAAGTSPQAAVRLFSAEERLLPLRAYRVVTADPSDPQYGLGEPAAVLRVETASGTTREVALGAATFTGGGFYAHLGEQSRRLYLVPRQTMNDLRSLIEGEALPGTDPLQAKADKADAEAGKEDDQVHVSAWLQQILDAGAHVPGGPE